MKLTVPHSSELLAPLCCWIMLLPFWISGGAPGKVLSVPITSAAFADMHRHVLGVW